MTSVYERVDFRAACTLVLIGVQTLAVHGRINLRRQGQALSRLQTVIDFSPGAVLVAFAGASVLGSSDIASVVLTASLVVINLELYYGSCRKLWLLARARPRKS